MTALTPPALVDGGLPLGRWTVSDADLDTYVTFGNTAHRAELLGEWRTLTDALREAVGQVAACWLSGSFFTDKDEPGDIDCLYVVDRELLEAALPDPSRAQFLQIVSTSQVKSLFQLRVDSFVLPWWPEAGTSRGSAVRCEQYLQSRGYWDDFWTRARHSDGRTSSLPRRGYLEVILDGYQ